MSMAMLDHGIKSHIPLIFHTSTLFFADQPPATQSKVRSQVTSGSKLSFKKKLALKANWSGFKASFHAMLFGTNPTGILYFLLLPDYIFLDLTSFIIILVTLCLPTHSVPGLSSVTFLWWQLTNPNPYHFRVSPLVFGHGQPSTPYPHPGDRQVVVHSWVSVWTQRKSSENCALQCKCRFCCCSWLHCPSLAGLRCSSKEKNELWRNRSDSLNVVEATGISKWQFGWQTFGREVVLSISKVCLYVKRELLNMSKQYSSS